MENLWTALFCTIHLCLGILVGRSGRSRNASEAILTPAALMPAVSQFERAYGVLQPSLSQMPDQFQAAMEELKRSVSLLAQELAKEKQKNAAGQPPLPANRADLPIEQNAASSLRLVISSGDVPPPAKSGADKRGAERLGYAVPEYMARFEDDLQTLGEFEEVQCHDLSATGVSFFRDQPLDQGDNILITLGQQSGGVVMAAKVMYSRAIIVRGEDRYRIGCQFLRRLGPEEAEQLQGALDSARSARLQLPC
jgi:hypothetical protein